MAGRIKAEDITPRHIRQSGEMSGSVTIPVGSTLADARRQLALRTFASTGGDHARTAKLLGVSTKELLGELEAILRDDGPGDADSEIEEHAGVAASTASLPTAASRGKVKAAAKRR